MKDLNNLARFTPHRAQRQGRHGKRHRQAQAGGHHLRAVPLDGRQLLRARHRQTPRRMAESRLERRRHHRVVAGLERDREGGVQQLGRGMYDPRHNIDGLNKPVVIPPAYGLAGIHKITSLAARAVLPRRLRCHAGRRRHRLQQQTRARSNDAGDRGPRAVSEIAVRRMRRRPRSSVRLHDVVRRAAANGRAARAARTTIDLANPPRQRWWRVSTPRKID